MSDLHTAIKGHKVKEALLAFCDSVLAGKQFQTANEKIETFLADSAAKELYVALTQKRAELQERQQRGFDVTAGQLAELDKLQAEAAASAVITGFNEASQELDAIKAGTIAYLEKSFEICRPPAEEDFAADDDDE